MTQSAKRPRKGCAPSSNLFPGQGVGGDGMVTVFEQVGGTTRATCDLGHRHDRVKTYRRYTLEIVETREVPNAYLRGYGDKSAVSTGMRAVDQFGTEWFSDWEFSTSDGWGGSRRWVTSDGRRAEASRTDGRPQHAFDGWVLARHDGQGDHTDGA